MKEVMNRIRGKSRDFEPHFVYAGLIILSRDIKRLKESNLEKLAPEFAERLRAGVNYAEELLSHIPDNAEMSLYANGLKEFIRRTSQPDLNPTQLLERLSPVYSALRNHHL